MLWFITICSAFQICWIMPERCLIKGCVGKRTQCAIIMSMAPINSICHALFVFKINFFKKFFQEHTERQMILIQILTNVCSALIWVQTVCKSYQQTTKIAATLQGKGIFSPAVIYTTFFLFISGDLSTMLTFVNPR